MTCNYDKLKVGDVFSRHSFGRVIGFQDNPAGGDKLVQVENESGMKWCVSRDVLEKEFTTNSQFASEKKVSATELASLFLNAKFTALTVNFNKKVETKEITKKLLALYPNKGGKSGLISKDDFKKLVKQEVDSLLVGEERTMSGYHKGAVDVNGRVHFVDLEAGTGYNMRLVDPRTINWVIYNGVKYLLKK